MLKNVEACGLILKCSNWTDTGLKITLLSKTENLSVIETCTCIYT